MPSLSFSSGRMIRQAVRSPRRTAVNRISAPSLLLILSALLLAGCGAETRYSADLEKVMSSAESGMASEEAAANQAMDGELALVARGEAGRRFATQRKIIYTAEIDLVVKDFASFEKQLPGMIASNAGFVAERKTDRQHGDHRAGRWVVRVPVANYDAFLAGVTGLGFARSRSETSDDVTEAYVDLQARISNKKKLEARILEMLEERPGKLTDLMAMEQELSRVREEVERMEGRMRVLNDQTSLATVRLSVSEEQTYVPPSAPTFGDRIASAWSGSTGSMGELAGGLVIAAVAVLPWAVLLLPLALIVWQWTVRGRGRRQYESAAGSA